MFFIALCLRATLIYVNTALLVLIFVCGLQNFLSYERNTETYIVSAHLAHCATCSDWGRYKTLAYFWVELSLASFL